MTNARGNGAKGRENGNGGGPHRADPNEEALRAVNAEQTSADADQTTSDSDMTASDADQTASAQDQSGADSDQRASDEDQATADAEQAADPRATIGYRRAAYEAARNERRTTAATRFGTTQERAETAGRRDRTAVDRDTTARTRDAAAIQRDTRAADLARAAARPYPDLARELEELRVQAAADRARAAADREQAARDRASAAEERARLEEQLRNAHLDDLTGVYRREMGRLALSHEIDRARRSDGRFVLAFVDVDDMKLINDRDGHPAGDRVLQLVVGAMRSKLRSFDPVMRYGGDEFVAGMGSTDLAGAKRRFDSVRVSLARDADVGISVGLAQLVEGDTPDELIARADAALLKVKAKGKRRNGDRAQTADHSIK